MAIAALSLVPDLLFSISWPIRRTLGQALFAGLLGLILVRLWHVRPLDDAPRADVPEGSRWGGIVLPLACGGLAWSYLKDPTNFAGGDWDVFLQKAESIRRTILVWGQFPWWDPWCRGGFPLAANPQVGVVGVATPLVLAFGSTVGMRLATVACLLIAAEGARRLARLWLGDPWASVAAGLIYGINGGVLVQAFAGYHMPMSYCACPWMLYHACRLDRRWTEGIWLGFWLAFDLLNGIQYYSVYAVLILAVAWLRAVRARSGPARGRYLAHTVLAAGTCLALAGWRLATALLVVRDFPRPYQSSFAETPWSVLNHLLIRPTSEVLIRERGIMLWDTTCYIGPIALVLALASINRGWRWWHALAASCGVLAIGSVAWYHPSYWLGAIPPFSTMHMVGRWRIMAMLGLGLAVGDELARMRREGSRASRWLAVGLVGVIAVDYVSLGRELLPAAFRFAPEESRFPGPPVSPIIQVDEGMAFPAVHRGYGMIAMPEPLLGYNQRADTARLARGNPAYVGESWTASGSLEPASWSPNRIEFRVAPHQEVFLNQNPGSWWRINGRVEHPEWRCAETRRVFSARADDRGRLVLEIRPRGLELGLGLHLAGLALLIVVPLSNLVPGGWARLGSVRKSVLD